MTCLTRASVAVTLIVAVGLGLTALVTLGYVPLFLAIGAAFIEPGDMTETVAGVVGEVFALPALILGTFAVTFVAVLLVLRRRPAARGWAIESLGIVVLVAMVGAAVGVGAVARDPAPALVVIAWLIWPGATLVKEGRHLRAATARVGTGTQGRL